MPPIDFDLPAAAGFEEPSRSSRRFYLGRNSYCLDILRLSVSQSLSRLLCKKVMQMKPPASHCLLCGSSQIASVEGVNYFPAHMPQKLNWTASKSLFPQHESSKLEARRNGIGGLSFASQTQVLKQLVQNSTHLCRRPEPRGRSRS